MDNQAIYCTKIFAKHIVPTSGFVSNIYKETEKLKEEDNPIKTQWHSGLDILLPNINTKHGEICLKLQKTDSN